MDDFLFYIGTIILSLICFGVLVIFVLQSSKIIEERGDKYDV